MNAIRSYVAPFGISFAAVLLISGCPPVPPTGGDPPPGGDPPTGGDTPAGFTNASALRGGSLYDKWWAVSGVTAAEPTTDHPRWAFQSTNTRTGSATWRCKECHGWDYKGLNGAYAEGSSHFTGFPSLFGTTLDAQAVFDKLADPTGHGFRDAGLSNDDLWDLAKFVLEGQIDTDDIIDTTGMFTGSTDSGQTLYDEGIGGNTACIVCHGADGLAIPPGADATREDFVGLIANDNAWEFQHKVRYGQPGSTMVATFGTSASLQDVNDIGTYSQTLPLQPTP